MNKKDLNKIRKISKKLGLNKAEKDFSRKQIISFMEENPVRSSLEDRLKEVQKSEQNTAFALFGLQKLQLSRIKIMPLVLAILIALSGGTAIAAEGAVPGDSLYGVKVNVNEEVRSWFAISDESEAELESDLIEERLGEAEKLLAESGLSGETQAKIKTRIEAHFERFSDRVTKLEAKNKVDVSARLTGRLEAILNSHADEIDEVRADVRSDITDLIIDLRGKAKDARALRIEFESEVGDDTDTDVSDGAADVEASSRTEVAASKTQRVATEAIETLEEALEENSDDINARSKAKAEASLEKAGEVYAEGEVAFESGNFGRAFALFSQVIREVQHGLTVIRTSFLFHGRIDIDARLENRGGDRHDNNDRDGNDETDMSDENDSDRSNDSDESDESGDSNDSDSDSDPESDSDRVNDSNSDSGTDVEVDARSDTDAEVDSDETDSDVDSDASVDVDVNL